MLFRPSERAPERNAKGPHNSMYNRRPFFCVLSAFNSLNDKIYIKSNKVSEKYLKIAFLGMQYHYCVSYHGVPPPDTQPTTRPTHPQNFLFFFIFSIGVPLVFPLSLCILRICVGRWGRSRRTDGNHQTWGLTISRHSVVALRDVVISLL